MMWEEAQHRERRERRSRLADHYRAAFDAGMQILISGGQAKPRGTWHTPDYLRPEHPVGQQQMRTPEERDRTLARLGAMFPGIVKRPA